MLPKKDDRLALGTQIVETNGVHKMSVTVMSAFAVGSVVDNGGDYLPEAELWASAAPLADRGLVLDNGFAKPKGEALVESRLKPAESGMLFDKPSPTKDAAWLAKGGPGLPGDFDQSWFQMADPSQQVGSGALAPGKEFSLAGSGETPAAAGRFPERQPWVRLESPDADGEVALKPVEMKADTVWFFPDEQKAVMIWHGEVPVADADASGVAVIRAGLDEQPAAEAIKDDLAEAAALAAPPPPLPLPPLAPPAPEPLAQFRARQLEEANAAVPEPVQPEPEVQEVDAAVEDEPEDVEIFTARSRPEEAKRQVEELLDAIENSEIMADRESLEVMNSVLVENDFEPLTEDEFQQHLSERIQAMKDLMAEISDADLEEKLRFSDDPDFDEEAAVREISAMIADLGVDAEEAEAMARDAFSEYPDLPDGASFGDFVDMLLGGDWSRMEISREEFDEMERASQNIDYDQMQAELDEFLVEETGKNLDALLDDAGDDIADLLSGDALRQIDPGDEELQAIADRFDRVLAEFESMPDEAEEDEAAAAAEAREVETIATSADDEENSGAGNLGKIETTGHPEKFGEPGKIGEPEEIEEPEKIGSAGEIEEIEVEPLPSSRTKPDEPSDDEYDIFGDAIL